MYEPQSEPTRDTVTMDNGATAHPVASLVSPEGAEAHFVVDDGCYNLVHDARERGVFRRSAWIFPEAFEVLRGLPSLMPQEKTS